MRRWAFACGLALGVAAIALIIADRLIYPVDVTQADLGRIREGMTLEEVQAAFGGPATRVQRLRRIARLHEKWPGDRIHDGLLFDPAGKQPAVPVEIISCRHDADGVGWSPLILYKDGSTSWCREWHGRTGILVVQFDIDERARWFEFLPNSPRQPNLLDRLRAWLGW
jgi:hypothetical protein